ncbi:hypothetical protein FKW77_010403 [Venturia effusa]|uniref:GST C-terminal domain-containing protein n=1 Tax=Venturia effusa TaxID=50376 RepID=A0A517L2D6_9PEZI|nr:hypothetical protein FKW77_010403 [Venturia effusa]
MRRITLYFPQASRPVCIAWLLDELYFPCSVMFPDRENGKAPQAFKARTRVQQWVHAAKSMFILHALATTYARWLSPQRAQDHGDTQELEKNPSVNMQEDFNRLDKGLEKWKTGFLVGKTLVDADIMVHVSVQYISARALGIRGVDTKKGKNVAEWVDSARRVMGTRKLWIRRGLYCPLGYVGYWWITWDHGKLLTSVICVYFGFT